MNDDTDIFGGIATTNLTSLRVWTASYRRHWRGKRLYAETAWLMGEPDGSFKSSNGAA